MLFIPTCLVSGYILFFETPFITKPMCIFEIVSSPSIICRPEVTPVWGAVLDKKLILSHLSQMGFPFGSNDDGSGCGGRLQPWDETPGLCSGKAIPLCVILLSKGKVYLLTSKCHRVAPVALVGASTKGVWVGCAIFWLLTPRAFIEQPLVLSFGLAARYNDRVTTSVD